MIWVLLSVVGLAGETALIIVLGRSVTSRFEAEQPADASWPTGARVVVRPDPAAPRHAA
jgi:hypothetical protein